MAKLERMKALHKPKILEPIDPRFPLDPLIAPMVAFLRDNEVDTIESCQGGPGHKFICPTIVFRANSDEVERVNRILKSADLIPKYDMGSYFCFLEFFTDEWIGILMWTRKYEEYVYPKVCLLAENLPKLPICSELNGKTSVETASLLDEFQKVVYGSDRFSGRVKH